MLMKGEGANEGDGDEEGGKRGRKDRMGKDRKEGGRRDRKGGILEKEILKVRIYFP